MTPLARKRLACRTRDLAAGSAFGAVALSGTVPLPVNVLFGAAWLVSMLGWRPLEGRRAWSVVVLLLVAVGLFGGVWQGLIDLVVAAVSFAALVTAHRLVSEPSPATDQQVLLASLLLIAGAAALSGELWFALCLVVFAVFACITMGLHVLEGPGLDEDVPVAPMLRQVGIGVLFAVAGGLAFFVAFPRLSWNVAARRTPPGVLGGTTGMSDRVRLGGGGSIKTSARVVLRANIQPDPKEEQLEQYWVGRYFDVFDGREWRGSGQARTAQSRVQVAPTGRRLVTQKIELLPAYESRTVVALEAPVLFDGAVALQSTGSNAMSFVHVTEEEVHLSGAGNGFTYYAYSRSPSEAIAPGEATPDEKYLQLPDSLDPRVAELALSVAGSARDHRDMARALERHLSTRYAYSLELGSEVSDPVAEFLFNRKAGHCEHFATALVLMLRTLGVPARVAAGFYGGERISEHYVVRAGDAHAWAQVWLDGRGWVDFDATPSEGRRNQPSALWTRLTTLYERAEEFWRSRVVDYSFTDQVTLVRSLVRPPEGLEANAPQRRLPWRPLGAAGLAGLLTFLLARWLLRPGPPKPHPAASFLQQIERRVTEAHVAGAQTEPIEELTHRLLDARHPLAPALRAAVARYLEARFGGRPLGREESERLLGGLTVRR